MPISRPLPWLALVLLTGMGVGHAQFAPAGRVKVSLVSETTGFEAGKPFTVALRMEHPEGFHSYWLNPGTGSPTTVAWELPAGWTAGPIVWPIPEFHDDGVSTSNIYHGTVHHLIDITPAPDVPAGSKSVLKGAVKWLECDVTGCRPASGEVALTVTAGNASAFDSTLKAAFDAVRAQQPRPSDAWLIRITESAADFVIALTPKDGANPDPGAIHLFERNKVIRLDPPKVEKRGDGTLTLTVLKEEGSTGKADGFLHAANGWLADKSLPALDYAANATLTVASSNPPAPPAISEDPFDGAPAGDDPPATTPDGKLSPATIEAIEAIIPSSGPKYVSLSGEAAKPLTFWWAFGLAFVGGIILNAMPCVFPVLGIKVLGFVQQAGEHPGKVRLHGATFTLGVLAAMWALAGVLIALNLGGARRGWGFLQQEAVFTCFIIVLLFVLALNLAGVFEMGTSLTTVGGGLMDRGGYAGSFFTGGLTTLVATPCSGPFLGAAIGYAMQQPPLPALLLFTGFGLGIAFPSLLLSLNPALLKWLPRPGPWMETFKIAMSFPLFATVVYFLNVLGAQSGRSGVIGLLTALVLIALALWIYGRWSTPTRRPRVRWFGRGVAALFATAGVWVATRAAGSAPETKPLEDHIALLERQITSLAQSAPRPNEAPTNAEVAGFHWEKWSPQRVLALRREGRPIFVDFTAVWCPTCQVNKSVVFSSPGSDAVKRRFEELHVVALKADWSNYDTVISEFLFRNDLAQIPANFVYPADAEKPPILLPQGLITQGEVLEAIEKAARDS